MLCHSLPHPDEKGKDEWRDRRTFCALCVARGNNSLHDASTTLREIKTSCIHLSYNDFFCLLINFHLPECLKKEKAQGTEDGILNLFPT